MAGCRLCSECVERFRLVRKVYKLCRVRNSFEWPCHRYRIGYGVVLTRRVFCMVIDSWLCIWLLWLPKYILVVFIVVILFIIVIFY
jgi:hypothetical protein